MCILDIYISYSLLLYVGNPIPGTGYCYVTVRNTCINYVNTLHCIQLFPNNT